MQKFKIRTKGGAETTVACNGGYSILNGFFNFINIDDDGPRLAATFNASEVVFIMALFMLPESDDE